MKAVLRTPAGLSALALVGAGVGYALIGALLARHGTSPAADPWLVTLLVGAGLALLARLLVRARQAQVDAHQLARHPERAYVRDASRLQLSDTTRRGSVRDLPSRGEVYRVGALAGAAALVGALLLASVLITRAADADLMDTGTRVQGQVVAGGWDYAGRGPRGYVDVRYAGGVEPTAGEQRGRVHGLDPLATPVGTQVLLVFHPADPSRVAAEDVPNHSHAYELWLSALLLVLLGLGVALVVALRHALARRRAVATGSWVEVPALVGATGRDGLPVALELDGTVVVGRIPPGGPGRGTARLGATTGQPVGQSLEVLVAPEHLPTSVLVRRAAPTEGPESTQPTERPEPTDLREVRLPRTLAEAERVRGRLGLELREGATPRAPRSSVGSS